MNLKKLWKRLNKLDKDMEGRAEDRHAWFHLFSCHLENAVSFADRDEVTSLARRLTDQLVPSSSCARSTEWSEVYTVLRLIAAQKEASFWAGCHVHPDEMSSSEYGQLAQFAYWTPLTDGERTGGRPKKAPAARRRSAAKRKKPTKGPGRESRRGGDL